MLDVPMSPMCFHLTHLLRLGLMVSSLLDLRSMLPTVITSRECRCSRVSCYMLTNVLLLNVSYHLIFHLLECIHELLVFLINAWLVLLSSRFLWRVPTVTSLRILHSEVACVPCGPFGSIHSPLLFVLSSLGQVVVELRKFFEHCFLERLIGRFFFLNLVH